MSEQNYETWYLNNDGEYIFGQDVVALLDSADSEDHAKADAMITETQAVAASWLDSGNSATQQRYRGVKQNFEMLTPDDTIPAHLEKADVLQTDVVRWIAHASRNDLTDFMRWNVTEYKDAQTRLDAVVPVLEQDLIRRITTLAKQQDIPAHAVDAYQQSITKTDKIKVMDPITVGEHVADGMYTLDEFRMGLNASLVYNLDEDELRRVFIHEHGHGTEAVGYKSLHDMGNGQSSGWLREAFNEHVAQTAMRGNFSVMSPADRNLEGSYRPHRLLMHALTQLGRITIPPQVLAEAYFAKPTDTLDGHRFIHEQVNQSFDNYGPEGLLTRISREYHAEQGTRHAGDAVMKRWYNTLVDHASPSAESLLERPADPIIFSTEQTALPIKTGEVSGYIYI